MTTKEPLYNRNGPCPCNSGIVYKFCHQAVLEAAPEKVLEAGHEQYARAWATNSGHYEVRGYYRDLAQEVVTRQPRRILDFGCGLGQGLKAIAASLPLQACVVGLDENPRCLDQAASTLRTAGATVTVIKRMTGVPVPGERYYDLNYEPGRLSIAAGITLIQSDFMEDPELEDFLGASQPFDAVTFWFTGVHKARQGLRRLRGMDMDRGHREMAENRVFELASRVLRTGGFVHLAERCGSNDFPGLLADRRAVLQEIAGAGFDVLPLTVRPYSEPTNLNRIGMGSREFDMRRRDIELGMVSSIAIRT